MPTTVHGSTTFDDPPFTTQRCGVVSRGTGECVRLMIVVFRHDSRGNDPEQAILYHGGEAAHSRNTFLALPSEDRHALIEFLKSL